MIGCSWEGYIVIYSCKPPRFNSIIINPAEKQAFAIQTNDQFEKLLNRLARILSENRHKFAASII